MIQRWTTQDGGNFCCAWQGINLSIQRTAVGRWHLLVNGVNTKGDYGTPRLAMNAVDLASDRIVMERINEVRAV